MASSHDPNEKHPIPSGTVTSSPPSRRQEDDLPEAIKAGGAAEVALDHADKVQSSHEQSDLCKALRSDLGAIRREYRSLEATFGQHPQTKEDRYHQVHAQSERRSNANPVFRYALALHDKNDKATKRLWEPACKEYLKRPDDYDHLLGDFVPSCLRTACRDHLEQQAYVAGTNATAVQDWHAYQRRLRQRRKQQTYRLSTGFAKLDHLTGGLPKFAMLGGSTGVGKTSFALALAVGTLRAHPDLSVLFYSLDMSKDVIFDRLLCQQSGLDHRDLWHKHDDPGVNSRLCEAEKALTASVLPRLRILEREQLGRGKEQILTALNKQAAELTQQSRTQHVLYILDYFQLIDVADPSTASLETDFSRIELLQTAQQMTRSQQCPGGDCFLVLTEVRKGESGRPRLALDDLMGSARISYSADCVLLLEAEGETPESAADAVPLQLTVAKGRDGMKRGRVRLTFEYSCHRFREAIGTAQASAAREPAGSRSAGHVINPLAGAKEC